uniref:RING-type E3 ubiquitin transferase n=1 Tax=Pan paniscus TaxID=9597 RepID=A0A2R8ZU72_PANPA
MVDAAAPRTTATISGAGAVTCRYFMHGVYNCHYSYDLSDSLYGVVCNYFQQGYCIYGDRCRYEHSKPLKQEEATATELTKTLSLAASSSLSSIVGPLVEMNTGKAESRNSNFDWVNTIEFVPGQPYCGCTVPSCTEAPLQGSEESKKEQTAVETKKQLCPYAAVGEYSCDMCGVQVLHPMRSQHVKSCIEAHKKDVELSLAVQHSKDMVCGICMEKANPNKCHFRILSNGNHTYSLKCICKWRSAKQFESKIIKSCPECHITSNFVIPSEYWEEEKEEKQKFIQKYKEAMRNKACRYFDKEHGSCPFGGNCFYKHVYPDGHRKEPQRQKVGTSTRSWAQRRNHFWELIEERENSNPSDNDEEEVVTSELGKMLLMLWAAGRDDRLTDSEYEWDLFHDKLEDFYDLDL